MGIQAPIQTIILARLQQKGILLLVIFAVSFSIVFFLSKKNLIVSTLASVAITGATAFYLVESYISGVRY